MLAVHISDGPLSEYGLWWEDLRPSMSTYLPSAQMLPAGRRSKSDEARVCLSPSRESPAMSLLTFFNRTQAI